MRLALVGPGRPFRGGIAQYNTQLFEHLRQRHEVLLINFTRQYPGLFFPGTTQFEEPPGVTVGEAIIDSINPLTWSRAGQRLLAFDPSSVVFQWWHPLFGFAYRSIMRKLSRNSSCRQLLLCHNVHPHERLPGGRLGSRLEKGILRSVFRQADGFLTHSAEMAIQIRELGALAPVQEIFLPSFTQFGSADTNRPAISSGPLHLLFFGNIRPYKGLDVLIEALALLPGDLDYELRVAGEFYKNRSQLLELSSRLGVSHRIQWEDRYIPDAEVASLFDWASVLISPYLHATQSAVIPVAYQFGIPVITTDVGGLSEVVWENDTGLLVRPGDPADLARAIQAFSRSRERIPWSRNVLRRRAQLSWDQVENAILSFSDPG